MVEEVSLFRPSYSKFSMKLVAPHSCVRWLTLPSTSYWYASCRRCAAAALTVPFFNRPVCGSNMEASNRPLPSDAPVTCPDASSLVAVQIAAP